MDFERVQKASEVKSAEAIDFRNFVETYLPYARWFVVSVIIFLIIAFLKIKFTTPTYGVSASILIKQIDKGNSISGLDAFEDLGLYNSGDNSLENEMEFLRSRRLMMEVVEELKLNIRYFVEDYPLDREIYPNYPVYVEFVSDSLNYERLNSQFSISIISPEKFEIFDFQDNSVGVKSFNQEFNLNLGNDDGSNHQMIRIHKNSYLNDSFMGQTLRVYLNSYSSTADDIISRLTVEPIDERYSKVLKFYLEESVIEKGVAILNNLIDQYNLDEISDKDEVARATTEFLDDRLILLSNELEAIETSAAQFKTSRGYISSEDNSDVYLESSTSTENEMLNANTQLELVNYMLQELNRIDTGELLPSNIGLSDQSVLNWVRDYNDIILKRNRILKSSSVKNPIVIELDSQLDILRTNLVTSLQSMKSSAQIQIAALSKRSGSINSKMASVPKYEKEYKNIIRGQETKNALYLFLLQKREESILSNAVQIEKAKVIDAAYSNGDVVSPKKILVYLGSFILGILIPFSILYLRNIFDTKVKEEQDLKHLNIPYLGDIPMSRSMAGVLVKEQDNTQLAEAFRYLRTNLNFIFSSSSGSVSNNGSKTIFVTSTTSGEGKTFVSLNLAKSLAISGKKVLLLAADLRAPRVNSYMKLNKTTGISNFVKDPLLDFEDVLLKNPKNCGFDIIASGDIPPNPVELLANDRLDLLFNRASSLYDFVIVDTAPVGMVTDTLQISKYADLSIYVIKSSALDKRMLHIPEKLNREQRIKNMAFLINCSDHSKGSYGYGYSYSYGKKEKKSWIPRFSKAAM